MALTPEGGQRKWETRWPAWVAAATLKHAGKYSYPSSIRVGSPQEGWKIRINCPEHGEFMQVPGKHLFGQGCAKCVGMGTDKVAALKRKYPELAGETIQGMLSKEIITLRCEMHGPYPTKFNKLMNKKEGVPACPKCAQIKGGTERRGSHAEWAERIQERWGDQIKLVRRSDSNLNKALFWCKDHGEFKASLNDVWRGKACTTCGHTKRSASVRAAICVTPEEFLARAALKTAKYTYNMETFKGVKTPMQMFCEVHGEFWQIPANHITLDANCPSCSHSVSKGEDAIAGHLVELGIEVVRRDRKLLGGWEVDIMLPEFRIAIEYCGIYWHGELRKDKSYHAEKLARARAAGWRLITIFEDEWRFFPDKVMNQLLTGIGEVSGAVSRVGARSTKVVRLSWSDAKEFLETWHMQGAGKPSGLCYGLEHNGRLVSVATWGKDRFSKTAGLELFRLCTLVGVQVVGGISKLLKAVMRDMPEIKRYVTYADLRWGTGNAYGKVGFTRQADTAPGYFWCKGHTRSSRQLFQKHKLEGRLQQFDASKTEVENCHANGYWRIYDCGHSKWELLL